MPSLSAMRLSWDLPGIGGLMYVGVAVLVGQDREVVAGGFAFAADQLLLPFP